MASKKEIANQFINFFWTILCFWPVLWYWIGTGINTYFYISIGIAFVFGFLPAKALDIFTLSHNRRPYERLGVKRVRRFVQNGDAVRSMTGKQEQSIVGGIAEAKRYLKTIAMYERFHWICLVFFLLTSILCFIAGRWKPGLVVTAANLTYNVSAILLQQYNKVRIKRIMDKL